MEVAQRLSVQLPAVWRNGIGLLSSRIRAMALAQSISVGFVVASMTYYLIRAAFNQRRMKGAKAPPGPSGLPFLGNALDLAKEPHLVGLFIRWANQYGSIMKFSILGDEQVVISNEKVAQDLFAKRGNIYSDRGIPPALEVFSGGLAPALINKNDRWRRQRKMMHSVMSIAVNDKFEPFMELESKYTLLDLLETPENFDDHLGRYAFGVLFRSALGLRVRSMQEPLVQRVEHESTFATDCFRPDKYLSNLVPWLLKLPKWICAEYSILSAAHQRFVNNIFTLQKDLREKMAKGTAPESLHKYFLENQDEFELSDVEGGSVLWTFLGAGTRSPHNALLQFFIVMMNSTEWMVKLQDEVERVVGPNRLPEFSDIPNLPTVRAVIKESIRYRSVVAEIGIPHKLAEDDIYENHFFKAGTVFHANFSTILTDPEMYPDGETFNPGRWLDPSYPTYKEPLTVYPNLANFTSFGYGRRACPASNFVERSMSIMVARIAWACTIKLPTDPATGKKVQLDIKYPPSANPKPYPFPAEIVARSQEKTDLVRRAVREALEKDTLEN